MDRRQFLYALKSGSILGLMTALQGSCSWSQNSSTSKAPSSAGSSGKFQFGIDFLAQNRFDLLRGKRVGLITNQTSQTLSGQPTRQLMQRSGVQLTALFVPEHGLDGKELAGVKVASRRDPMTGLTAYSLYGATREPTAQMLSNVDTLVFDLQDIGCRSYTYISTMILAMRACGKHGKEFVVLDRPNPLGGHRIEGPSVEPRWISFVGQIPVPYVHGMTAGELARMSAAQGWVHPAPAKFKVVPMRGWRRSQTWPDLGIGWRRTSPNIPNGMSSFYYVATGILGGAAAVDIGIGTEEPFGYAGGRRVHAEDFCRTMRKAFPEVQFTPYERNGFGGARLKLHPRTNANLTALDVVMLAELNQRSGNKVLQISGSKLEIFNKVYGSAKLRDHLLAGKSPWSLIREWNHFNQQFRSQRQKYLLYV